MPFLKVCHLSKQFGQKKILHDLSFTLEKGMTLGVVGESGCGKSTLGKLLLRLLTPTQGQIFFKGKDLSSFTKKELFSFRRNAQIIFQDSYSALSPRMTAEQIIREPLIIHKLGSPSEQKKRIHELFELVGLSLELKNRFPHELSGGQRQRIGIARALSLSPEFLVCDEPVSSLDVSTQQQMIDLLKTLQQELSLTYFFITHDIGVLSHMADQTLVLYQGNSVEFGLTSHLLSKPQHPYTQTLIQSARATLI